MKRGLVFLFVVFFSNLIFADTDRPFPNPDKFPEPAAYKPNVDFWVKVYSEWEDDKMVIHDSLYLDIVFDVIEIPEDNNLLQTAARAKVKARVSEIKQILLDLHKNPQAKKLSDDHEDIFELYQNKTGPDKFARASERIRVQQGIKQRFHKGLEEMTRFIDQIKKVMREEGLPEEISYLPLVESSFNNQSLSKTRAAGIWQFMPGTARLYMKVNSDVDERLDPAVATRAAARYLKRSYQMFGNWPVSLTSYNHGQQGMRNAVSAVGTSDFMTIVNNYTGKYYGFASKNFYAEFLAACKVMIEADKHFDNLKYKKPLRVDPVRLSKPLYATSILNHTSLTREELREYNPALQSSVLFSRRPIPAGYVLNLPAGRYKDPVQLVTQIRTGSSTETQKPVTTAKATSPPSSNVETYVVKRGDTLFSISKRFSTTVSALRELNSLTHNLIHPGQRLRIGIR